MKDYSQSGEQGVILKYFGDFCGAFIDAGANDGVTLSNSRALAELGWSGICIEPAEIAYRKLHLLYSGHDRVHTVNAAITTQDGPIDFYDSGTHLHMGDTSLLSTTRPEEMNRWKKSGEQFAKTTVRGITVATMLAETGLTRADFISIDCEGADWSIVQQMDLTAVGCRMLCVEGNQSPNRKDFIAYAAKHGMKLHHQNYENLIFAR